MSETFGQACLQDLPQLVELLGILFSQEQEHAPDGARQERALRLILGDARVGRIYVAREGPRVLGMVNIQKGVSTAEGGPAAYLEDFVVRPELRGRGVGTRLIRYAIEESRKESLLRLMLLTDGDNTSAQRLYESVGFARSGMLPMRLKL